MPFVPFYSKFWDLAKAETRSLTVFNDRDLPRGTYFFIELFCNERGCDCRRVILQVRCVAGELCSEEPLANISFGWEPDQFYRDWASFPLTAYELDELRGPALQALTFQSKYAEALLAHARTTLRDELYVQRIMRHYQMFRSVVDRPRRLADPKRSLPKAKRKQLRQAAKHQKRRTPKAR